MSKVTCHILELHMRKVDFLAVVKSNAAIVHQVPERFSAILIALLLPFLQLSLFSLIMFHVGIYLFPEGKNIFLWLGVSSAIYAFPGCTLSKLLWRKCFKNLDRTNNKLMAGISVIAVLCASKVTFSYWVELVYGSLLYFLVLNSHFI